MLTYIETLFNIALRKLGPEDLPDSQFLLGVTLGLYLLVDFPVTMIVISPAMVAVQRIAVALALLVAFTWILLRLSEVTGRYCRTLTALLGTRALITVVFAPFAVWARATNHVGEPQ